MIGLSLLFVLLLVTFADAKEGDVIEAIDAGRDEFAAIAHSIWEYAELGYLEERSSELLKNKLAAAGFRIQSGVADIPTAFIAERGSGWPVVALLAEFDALPGMSQ